MKKIILSAGMLIAIATVSFAQNNTSTLNQTLGARNTATMTQSGQNLNAVVNQAGTQTTDNSATIEQTGRASTAVIIERGKFQEVFIRQDNTATGGHQANVNILDAASQNNSVDVIQSGKLMEANIDLEGDGNVVTFMQSGDKNRAELIMNTSLLNDDNSVSITQMGNRNQSSVEVNGDRNTVSIDQRGLDNRIGAYMAAGVNSVDFIPGPPVGPVTIVVASANLTVPSGILVEGDDNSVTVTQGANTRDNQVAINLSGNADNNSATVTQSQNAEDNVAAILVDPNQDGNTAVITQADNAMNNEAGIHQQGDNDMATIIQAGNGNAALIVQKINTTVGSNKAFISQPGSNNEAYIQQDGTRGSNATIYQFQDGGTVAVYQTAQGEHSATITQDSDIAGARLILQQNGRANTANLVQTDINFTATDVEIIQNGQNNTVNGLTNPGNQRIVQNGNGNVASY